MKEIFEFVRENLESQYLFKADFVSCAKADVMLQEK